MKRDCFRKYSKQNLPAIIVFAALVWTGARTSLAGPTVMTPETWDSGLQGWGSDLGVATIANSVIGNPYLLITFNAYAGAPDPSLTQDTIYTKTTPATTSFTGDYIAANVASASFSFLNSVTPAGASLVFGSAAREWSLAFTPVSSGSWNTYNIYFNYSLGWSSAGTTAADFLADLHAVSWIGIHIDRSGTGSETYGLDNFELMIPEPADFYLLAAGVLGMVLALRRKRSTGIQA